MLEGNGEVLRINILDEEDDYNIYNVTSIVDALDKEHSTIKYFRSSGRIMRIKEYVFNKESLEGIHIFKLPEPRFKKPFVSEEFVRIIEKSGFTGFRFELVWEG